MNSLLKLLFGFFFVDPKDFILFNTLFSLYKFRDGKLGLLNDVMVLKALLTLLRFNTGMLKWIFAWIFVWNGKAERDFHANLSKRKT